MGRRLKAQNFQQSVCLQCYEALPMIATNHLDWVATVTQFLLRLRDNLYCNSWFYVHAGTVPVTRWQSDPSDLIIYNTFDNYMGLLSKVQRLLYHVQLSNT